MNRTCNLTKRVITSTGKRFCPVVWHGNGRIRPDWVYVDGKPERHTEGAYYIEWHAGKKRIRKTAGKDSSAAEQAHRQQLAILNAKVAGVQVVENTNGAGELLVDAATIYLRETKLAKKPRTYAVYKVALDYFQESCKKQRVAEVDRRDLLQFRTFLRDEKKLSPRTVANKFQNVVSFLKVNGRRGLVTKDDWPKYVEEEPEVYEPEELAKFFAACRTKERTWFEFFLMTGCREQEVMFATWKDINFVRGTVAVRFKPEYNFAPKTYREREVPIPDKLLATLKQWKDRAGACPLVFHTSRCRPKTDFIESCKAVAERAGLDPAGFWLHKFRSTFATVSLWSGVDLRTVQDWMGHKDMQSTMRYLKPNRGQVVRDKINAAFRSF